VLRVGGSDVVFLLVTDGYRVKQDRTISPFLLLLLSRANSVLALGFATLQN